MENNDLEKARQTMMLRIKCLHCLQTYQDPRLLPCGHSFCLRCLESIFSASLSLSSFSRYRSTVSFLRRSGGRFLCPTCTTLINVPLQGVIGFPLAQSIDEVKKLAVEEMSKILLIKYRRRTTGNITPGECKTTSEGFINRATLGGDDLILEEKEEEDLAGQDLIASNRHSYPSYRVENIFNTDPTANSNVNNKTEHNSTETFPIPDYEHLPTFERNRRSRRSNRNTKSNLKPTSEYSDISPKPSQCFQNKTREDDKNEKNANFSNVEKEKSVADKPATSPCKSSEKFIHNEQLSNSNGKSSGNYQNEVNNDQSNIDSSREDVTHIRGRLSGSRSFSTLDQNKGFVSTARRCFSLRDKIRRDQPHSYSDSIEFSSNESSPHLPSSNFVSNSRLSFGSSKQNSSSFDSSSSSPVNDYSCFTDTGIPSSISTGIASQHNTPTSSYSSRQNSRFKSAPENLFNISFKPANNPIIVEEPPMTETCRSRERPTFGSSLNGLRSSIINNRRQNSEIFDQPKNDEDERKPTNPVLIEKEIKERLAKYRKTPENSGTAKLIRVLNDQLCLPSAISSLPNKCLAVADHGLGSVVLFDASWTASRSISRLKPFGMAYSEASGSLYVTDRRTKTVLLYDPTTGEKRESWQADAFNWICSIVVINDTGNSEQLAVLDRCTSSVKICDVETGRQVRQFGSYGNDRGQFCMAEFMTWDPRCEHLLVSDSGNHRIVAFDPRQGDPTGAFGHRGVGDESELQWPKGLSVDQKSNICVADSGNRRISRFTADGSFIDNLVSPINAPYSLSIENNYDSFYGRKFKRGIYLNVTTFSLQNKAQLFRYSI